MCVGAWSVHTLGSRPPHARPVSPHLLASKIEAFATARARAARGLAVSSWTILGILGGMAVSMWVVPFANAAGHRTIANAFGVAFLVEFFALIATVVLLRRRMAAQIQ